MFNLLLLADLDGHVQHAGLSYEGCEASLDFLLANGFIACDDDRITVIDHASYYPTDRNEMHIDELLDAVLLKLIN